MKITEETIDYVSELAKLQLTEEEKEKAKVDIGKILDYMDKMNEIDTKNISPMTHVFEQKNIVREDIVTNGLEIDQILANAPVKNHECFIVPKTVE